jgi:hypothetical protein
MVALYFLISTVPEIGVNLVRNHLSDAPLHYPHVAGCILMYPGHVHIYARELDGMFRFMF